MKEGTNEGNTYYEALLTICMHITVFSPFEGRKGTHAPSFVPASKVSSLVIIYVSFIHRLWIF